MQEKKLTRQEILEHCKRASDIVKSWPKWEQNLLENSLLPQWGRPREVIYFNAKVFSK